MNFNIFLLIKFRAIGRILRKTFVLILLLLSLGFVGLSKTNSQFINKVNALGLDIIGPVMYVIEFPARIIHRTYSFFYDVSRVFADNEALREENKQMLYLQNKVHTLQVENMLLSQLLNYSPPKDSTSVSAKVVAEAGDDFTHALVIYTGESSVKKGQVVLSSESVIGRIESAGDKYAKVMLLNDIGSKIPVVIERTRARGILSGNNTRFPQLIYTKSITDIQEGDLLVTSGVGGVFPGGLPIGFINSVRDGEIDVEPIADLDRVEYVRVVDYGISLNSDDYDNSAKDDINE